MASDADDRYDQVMRDDVVAHVEALVRRMECCRSGVARRIWEQERSVALLLQAAANKSSSGSDAPPPPVE